MMGVRSLEQLRVDQAAILSGYRSRTGAGEAAAGAEEIDVVSTFARVTTVVTSDPVYGAHLVVRPQEFVGVPPAPADASKPTLRAYATPNHAVGDYGVNEIVLLLTARGGLVAGKLG